MQGIRKKVPFIPAVFSIALLYMKRSEIIYRLVYPFITAIAVCLFIILTLTWPGHSDPVRRELEDLDPSFRESVLRGWRYFQTSFAADGVACVHCHRDHSDLITWPGSYPKVQIFDGTPYGVKTLRTVIIEALARHTDLGPVECSDMAEDLQAYIAWWGDGQPLTPGISKRSIPPDEDLEELMMAVRRGMLLFNREKPVSCVRCHTIGKEDDGYRSSLKGTFTGFPRSGDEGERALSFDLYLLDHYRRNGIVMSPKSITDIASYLAHLSREEHLKPGSLNGVEEVAR